jgi:hypothetical protein
MMTDDHLDELIDRHLNGTLDDAGRQELEHRLLHSASDRARFWQLAETHVLVHEGVQRRLASASDAAVPGGTADSARATPPAWQRGQWLQWRPLTAAAAGLALGVFCASAAWAYVSPGLPKFVKHVLAVANAGFEDDVTPLPNGVPVRYGVWSGDHAALVGPEQGITPKQGRRMFRFLRSDSTEASSRGTIFNGNIYQVIDVRSSRDAIANGTAVVDWSAWFNCVPEPAAGRTKFVASVWAFVGDTAILPRNWADKLYQESAYSSWKIVADDDPRTWQRIAGKMMVPPDADFLVVELKVVPADPVPVEGAVEFPGHYADDVELILRTNARPTAPTFSSLNP